jgi:hypothetical protein
MGWKVVPGFSPHALRRTMSLVRSLRSDHELKLMTTLALSL